MRARRPARERPRASAVSVPTEPPLTSTPSVPSGSPHPVAQPLEHGELDGGRARAADPAAGEHVHAGAGEVGEHGERVARAADAGEEARVARRAGRARAPRRTGSRAPRRDRSGRPGRAGRGAGDHSRVEHRHRRLAVERRVVLHQPVDHAVPEPAQLLGLEAEVFRSGHAATIRAMRAAVMHAFEQPLSLETVPDPGAGARRRRRRGAGDRRVPVDWHGWMGHDPSIALPHVPGHELAGVVAEVGAEVRGFAAGDRVTVPFCCGCGSCDSCRQGETQLCERDLQPGLHDVGLVRGLRRAAARGSEPGAAARGARRSSTRRRSAAAS